MKILVYGAGPLGSLFAAQLHLGGHEVSILARGQRLADLREHGIVLHDMTTEVWTTSRVNVVEQLAPEDVYDLILVIMRKNNALDILPILAENKNSSTVLFLMNNAAGPDAFVQALGKSRVLTGFPASAGYREGHIIHCLTGNEETPYPIPFGEIDGRISERVKEVASVIESAPAFTADIRTDMDAWHKYHVALLMPSIAPALYMCGTDRLRTARTRDALVLATRAIREGFKVLKTLGFPFSPPKYKYITWMPEPVAVWMLKRLFTNPRAQTALVGHANAARDEMQHLADEFMVLVKASGVPTPNIERLYPHFDPETPHMPDGSRKISMDWRAIWLAAGGLSALIVSVIWLLRKR